MSAASCTETRRPRKLPTVSVTARFGTFWFTTPRLVGPAHVAVLTSEALQEPAGVRIRDDIALLMRSLTDNASPVTKSNVAPCRCKHPHTSMDDGDSLVREPSEHQ
jgi:hypothetical protein